MGAREQRGHPRRGGRTQPLRAPAQPFIPRALLPPRPDAQFKVENGSPSGWWPCSCGTCGGDGTQWPGRCSGQDLGKVGLISPAAHCHRFQPGGFFSLSVCSSPLPAPWVSLNLPSCQRRAAAYANQCKLSAEKQQCAVTAHRQTVGSALAGCSVHGQFPSCGCFLPGEPQNQADQHPNDTEFTQSRTTSLPWRGRAEGFCYITPSPARNTGEMPRKRLVSPHLCPLLGHAWQHFHE